MKNLDLKPVRRPSAFRRIAMATWRRSNDPVVHGSMVVRMEAAERYIADFRAATGRRLTVTHLVCRAMGSLMVTHPDVNVIIRLGRLYQRQDRTVMFQVVMTDPESGKVDLSMHTVDRADERDLLEIIDHFETGVRKVRAAGDSPVERTRRRMKALPTWLTAWAMQLMAFLLYDLNLDLTALGVPSKSFGGIAVTNVGSLGIEEAYVPLPPYTRTPMFVALGAVATTPVIEGDAVVPGRTMKLMASFDHRVLDGSHAAALASTMRAWLEDPVAHFGPVPAAATDPVVPESAARG